MGRTFFRPRTLPQNRCSAKLLIRIQSGDMHLFRFLLEAYSHVALFTVLDKKQTLLKLTYSAHMESEVRQMLAEMKQCLDFQVEEYPHFPASTLVVEGQDFGSVRSKDACALQCVVL